MADTVDNPCAASLTRDEFLQQDAQDDQTLQQPLLQHVKQRQDQSFFHPETAKVLDLQAQPLQQTAVVLRNELDEEGAKRQRRVAYDQHLKKNMAVLQPFQAGLQEAADSEVHSLLEMVRDGGL